MASKKKCKWTLENLEKALEEVKDGKLSVRSAASKYEIPKSTVHGHLTHHDPGAKPGPALILSRTEEDELTKWIIEMSTIGYGQCRQQICLIVKRILDRENRVTPFPDNLPGKDWWQAFLRRHPEDTPSTTDVQGQGMYP